MRLSSLYSTLERIAPLLTHHDIDRGDFGRRVMEILGHQLNTGLCSWNYLSFFSWKY